MGTYCKECKELVDSFIKDINITEQADAILSPQEAIYKGFFLTNLDTSNKYFKTMHASNDQDDLEISQAVYCLLWQETFGESECLRTLLRKDGQAIKYRGDNICSFRLTFLAQSAEESPYNEVLGAGIIASYADRRVCIANYLPFPHPSINTRRASSALWDYFDRFCNLVKEYYDADDKHSFIRGNRKKLVHDYRNIKNESETLIAYFDAFGSYEAWTEKNYLTKALDAAEEAGQDTNNILFPDGSGWNMKPRQYYDKALLKKRAPYIKDFIVKSKRLWEVRAEEMAKALALLN